MRNEEVEETRSQGSQASQSLCQWQLRLSSRALQSRTFCHYCTDATTRNLQSTPHLPRTTPRDCCDKANEQRKLRHYGLFHHGHDIQNLLFATLCSLRTHVPPGSLVALEWQPHNLDQMTYQVPENGHPNTNHIYNIRPLLAYLLILTMA